VRRRYERESKERGGGMRGGMSVRVRVRVREGQGRCKEGFHPPEIRTRMEGQGMKEREGGERRRK
jgi:hypothetical protein